AAQTLFAFCQRTPEKGSGAAIRYSPRPDQGPGMVNRPIMETTAINVKWMAACRVDDVPGDGGACVLIDGEQIAIFYFSRRDEWYATENRCPHKQQMVLSRGIIGSAGAACEPKVACPFHKKTFS